jgi:class 3 adenylate cyclase
MALVLPHGEGQYRAEIFEELVGRILRAKYPDAKITQDFLTQPQVRSSQVDFFVQSSPRPIFVESRAPYSDNPWSSVRRSIRLLQELNRRSGADAILALAGPIPSEGFTDLESVRARFQGWGNNFELWDEAEILRLTEQYLGHRLTSLSTDAMLAIVGDLNDPYARVVRDPGSGHIISSDRGPVALPEGRHKGAIILLADFCSFSKFVHASRGDDELVSSVMGRLYREARKLIQQHGGILDKFMGDGVLAYWLPGGANGSDFAAQFLECAKSLTGMALKLAEEWQDQVDLAVEPIGMRCGAAVGDVLFIAEDPHGGVLVHAIGEEINIAARLQSEAEPNVMALSNRLKSSYFGNDTTCTEFVAELKNIGRVKAWKKALA